MIRVDRSATTVLAYCTRCPSFRALRHSDVDAWAAGSAHERAVHPSEVHASNAAGAARRRAH